MGRAAQTKAKKKRLEAKRARKQAMKAKYQTWAEQGVNSKSRRARKQAGEISRLVRNYDHSRGKCGNPGCKKCFGYSFPVTFFRKKEPINMPQWMYKAWLKEDKPLPL